MRYLGPSLPPFVEEACGPINYETTFSLLVVRGPHALIAALSSVALLIGYRLCPSHPLDTGRSQERFPHGL